MSTVACIAIDEAAYLQALPALARRVYARASVKGRSTGAARSTSRSNGSLGWPDDICCLQPGSATATSSDEAPLFMLDGRSTSFSARLGASDACGEMLHVPPVPAQHHQPLRVDDHRAPLRHALVREAKRLAAAQTSTQPGYPLPHQTPADLRPWQDVVRRSRTQELEPADMLTCETALCVPRVRASAAEHVEAVLLNQSRSVVPHGLGTKLHATAHLRVETHRLASGGVQLQWLEDKCPHPRFGDNLAIFVGLSGMSKTPWDPHAFGVLALGLPMGHTVMVSDDRTARSLDVTVIGHWSALPLRLALTA